MHLLGVIGRARMDILGGIEEPGGFVGRYIGVTRMHM